MECLRVLEYETGNIGRCLTRERAKVLEQTGGPMSVRGTKKTPVIFLLGYLGI